MFQCHLKVELYVSRVGGIKYLFKCVCKGSDRRTEQIVQDKQHHHEVGRFQDARYVSASEALCSLFQLKIVDRQSTVLHLDVHLGDHHSICIKEGQQNRAAQHTRPGTKFTEWFNLNQK